MNILKRLASLRTSTDHAEAGADIGKEISLAQNRIAELRYRSSHSPFEDEDFDFEAARAEIVQLQDRVQALQDVATENDRRRKDAAKKEADDIIERKMADMKRERAALIDDIAAFAAAAENLVSARSSAKARLLAIEAANREATDAGRSDLLVSNPIIDLYAKIGRNPAADPLEVVIPEIVPYPHPDGAAITRIGELR